MRRLFAALLVTLLGTACQNPTDAPTPGCASPGGAAAAPVVTADVVERYPHDPAAFTQGLVFADGTLYESTGRHGESSVRIVTLETGDVEQRVDLGDEFFGEGLAFLDGLLYQVTWQEGIGFVYRASDLQQVETFEYEGEGWGLTTDGTSLILSNGTNELQFLDPGSFGVTRTISVTDAGEPVEELNELEWIDGEVWANVWHTDRIARIDPQSGTVRRWLDLSEHIPPSVRSDPEAVLNGIAHDAATGRLFVTGKLWPTLLRIEVAEAPTPRCD